MQIFHFELEIFIISCNTWLIFAGPVTNTCSISTHMEMSTLLTPCSVQGCVQSANNLVNAMELQHFPPCYKVVNTLYHL